MKNKEIKLDKIYSSQKECYKAIEEGIYNASLVEKRIVYLKENINNITKIDGLPAKAFNIFGHDLEYIIGKGTTLYYKPIVYLDVYLYEN